MLGRTDTCPVDDAIHHEWPLANPAGPLLPPSVPPSPWRTSWPSLLDRIPASHPRRPGRILAGPAAPGHPSIVILPAQYLAAMPAQPPSRPDSTKRGSTGTASALMTSDSRKVRRHRLTGATEHLPAYNSARGAKPANKIKGFGARQPKLFYSTLTTLRKRKYCFKDE
jgi:hypothetical protein